MPGLIIIINAFKYLTDLSYLNKQLLIASIDTTIS